MADPADPGNQVLQLTASGATEHVHNHAETTFANQAMIRIGREYEISFRAKWSSGSNQLNTRLYFNKLARTTLLEVPAQLGTPGRANSRLEANIGPTFAELRHTPLAPTVRDPVTVSVRVADPTGVATVALWYSVDGGSWFAVPMELSGSGGRYRTVIPPQTTGATVHFYVEAEDRLGAVSWFPAAGPESRALYRVTAGATDPGTAQLLRLIMTPSDAALQQFGANMMSNGRLGATVIYNDREVFYDVGVRLRSSGLGRTGPRAGMNIRFPSEHLFRGVQRTIVADRSVIVSTGNSDWNSIGAAIGASPHDQLFDLIANRAGGIPAMQTDVVFLDAPRAMNTGPAALKLARYGQNYLDSQFDDGSKGSLFKYELIYFNTTTNDGTREGFKNIPNTSKGVSIANMGDDKEAYRDNYILRNNRDKDDFHRIIDLGRTLTLSGDQLDRASQEVMDVDQWMRVLAMLSLTGVGDIFAMGARHNVEFYVRPSDNRILIFPWDYDFAFFHRTTYPLLGQSNSTVAKVVNLPHNRRLFYGHMLDLIETSFNTTYLAPWIEHLTNMTQLPHLIPFFTNYVERRANYVLTQLNNVAPQLPFEITTGDGVDLTVDTPTVALEGTGWIDVHEVRRAGSDERLPVTWRDQETWQVELPLESGTNLVALEAYNFRGELVGTDSITVTSTAGNPLRDFLRMTEINFNPYDPLVAYGDLAVDNDQFEFIELTNTSADESLDLASVEVADGVEFTFGNVLLEPGERTLVVRNREAFESRYGRGLNVAGEFASGKLDNGGETIHVTDAAGATLVAFTYGDSDPWPGRADGKGATLELIDTEGDASDAGNWRSSSEFGGSPGQAGAGPLADVLVNEVLARPSDGGPDLVELVNTSDAATDVAGWYLSDDSGALLQWSIPAGTSIPAHGYLVVREDQFGFPLSGRQGDDLWLVAADPASGRPLRFVDHVEFGASDPGRSLGRWPNAAPEGELFPMTAATFGQANSGPVVGDVVVSELNYHPDARRFEQDFGAGTADPFVPQAGAWSIVDGRYAAVPDVEGDSLAILDQADLPPGPVTISATIRLPAESNFFRNGAIVFDYHSPTDFKYAAMFANGDWRIGRRDADGWNILSEVETTVMAERDYDVTVEIDGALVRLFVGGVERVQHDFGTPVDGGGVGLGSKNGEAKFDNVVVRSRDPEQFEFVELIGTATSRVELSGWRLDGAVRFQFPEGMAVEPGQTLVLVGFEPNDPRAAGAFRERFGLNEGLPLIGPYAGRLDNGGDDVQLARPADRGSLDTGYILVDRVRYDDQPPWPTGADGGGESLARITWDAFGDLAASWTASQPTPGSALLSAPGDMNLDGTVDRSDVDPFVLGLNNPSAYEAIFGVPAAVPGDMDADGDLDFDDIRGFVALLRANQALPDSGVEVVQHRELEIATFVDAILTGGPNVAADANGDGKVNGLDVAPMVAVTLRQEASDEI